MALAEYIASNNPISTLGVIVFVCHANSSPIVWIRRLGKAGGSLLRPLIRLPPRVTEPSTATEAHPYLHSPNSTQQSASDERSCEHLTALGECCSNFQALNPRSARYFDFFPVARTSLPSGGAPKRTFPSACR